MIWNKIPNKKNTSHGMFPDLFLNISICESRKEPFVSIK